MIVETSSTPIYREGLSNESLFNIKKENVAHIFSILRNQLYSDKILAVIREYSTNAMDAHVEDNVERPFEITLPTPLSSEFIVRDFGKGLSQQDIVDIFASYGESTKRSSNSYTGMLGLGSKSAFAYTNSFVVKSRHNGVEYTYSAFIDESNVGAISLVNQTPTNESGVSVHINVKASDCRLFEERCKSFFKYCTMMPKFTNNSSILESFVDKTPVAMEGSDWKIYNTIGEIVVHMGNVSYTVPYGMMNDFFTPEQNLIVKGFRGYHGYLQGTWHIFAPIGSVKPSASRESLEFNDGTKSYIGTKVYEICLEIHSRILSEFVKKKSEWEKRIYADSMNKLMHNLPQEMISYCHPFLEKDLAPLGITKTRYERSTGRFSDDKHPSVVPKSNVIYFLDSPEISRNSVRERINNYLNTNNIVTGAFGYYNPSDNVKAIGIIHFNTDENKKKFKKNKDFLGMNWIDLSELSYDPKKKSNPNAIKGDVGELFIFHPNEYYNLKKWKATEDRPQKIVWVEISNFMPKEYKKDNRELNNILESLSRDFLSLNENVVLYGVKSAHIKNVGSDWIELKDYYKNRIEEFKIKHKAEYDAYCRFDNLSPFWKSFIFDDHNYHYRVGKPKTFDPKNYKIPDHFYSPFKPLYLEYCLHLFNSSNMSNIYKTARFLDLEFFKEQKIEEIDKLVSDIPILSVFQYSSVPFEDLHKKITELL